jgi:hypothetical protein
MRENLRARIAAFIAVYAVHNVTDFEACIDVSLRISDSMYRNYFQYGLRVF